MKRDRLREQVKQGGIIGLVALLLLGVYVAWRVLTTSRTARWVAAIALVSLGAWLLFSCRQMPRQVTMISQELGEPRTGELSEPPAFEVIDLGTLGEGVVATGINERGDVSGFVILNDEEVHAVVWQGGKMRDLGTLGGGFSVASGVNASGQVIGVSETRSQLLRGFQWRDGRFGEVPPLDGLISVASGINGRGDITGFSSVNRETVVACLWQNGKAHPLQTPRGYAFGIGDALNESRLVAGYAITEDMERVRACSWENGKPRELPTLGGEWSLALAVGSRGEIGGTSQVRGAEEQWNACLWEGGKLRDLGRLPEADWAMVTGINKDGLMVGASGAG